jgi:hypothetical protein
MDIRETIRSDEDVDIEAVTEYARDHYQSGSYMDQSEMEGAIVNHIASQFRGWEKYDHLDASTETLIEDEIRELATEIAEEIIKQERD